ncbi:MAG TPA: AMP-binding protein, partial [Aeromicrobium sp.]|nr:AMP-binding protein [Aeromicrobium sp.]
MTNSSILEVGTLSLDVLDRLPAHRDDVALARRVDGRWHDITLGQFHAEVIAVAKGLIASGVSLGDRVAVLSKTRYEWTVVDYAIWWIGAVTVPIYETSAVAQIEWILSDSGAVAAIVEAPDHRDRVEQARSSCPDLRHVWTIEDAAEPVGGVDQIVAVGADVTDEAVEALRSQVLPESLATLIYTSGTTGRPKGCRLTHGNFRSELAGAIEQL